MRNGENRRSFDPPQIFIIRAKKFPNIAKVLMLRMKCFLKNDRVIREFKQDIL